MGRIRAMGEDVQECEEMGWMIVLWFMGVTYERWRWMGGDFVFSIGFFFRLEFMAGS